MAGFSSIPLDEVVYFNAITSNSVGQATDADSTPTWAVYEEATDTPIVTGDFTKRTGLTGNYRGTFTASAANGFEVGKWYNVVGSATVGGVVGKCVCMMFRCTLTETTAGAPVVDAAQTTGDTGITLPKALEMLAAFMAGKVSASSAGGVTTYTYKKRDGSTTSFTSPCSETDGTRATTGDLS